jgi:hypothetical protein
VAGFGRSPFGRGPFGRSDLGNDLLIELFPDQYFDDSLLLDQGETIKDNDKDPLLKLLKVYKNSVNLRRLDIERMPSLIDYETASLEIVRLWGDLLGLGIDKNDPEFLQRSFLGNASQWLQLKGSTRGYQVRGLASGFTVSVENFWRIDPIYEAMLPARNRFKFKPFAADPTAEKILHTDSPPGTHAGTPLTEDYTYAKSAYVRVILEVAEPRRPFIDYNILLDLIIAKIKDVVAIHHELLPLVFQIRMKIPVPITVDFALIEENTNPINAMVQGVYDIEAADAHETDFGNHLTVSFAEIGPGFVWEVPVPVSAVIEIEEDILPILGADVSAAFGISQIEEYVEAEAATSIFVDLKILPSPTIVPVAVSASIDPLIAEFTQDIVATLNLSAGFVNEEEAVEVDGMGWSIDPMSQFDLTAGDVIPLDSSGTVEMTVIVGP